MPSNIISLEGNVKQNNVIEGSQRQLEDMKYNNMKYNNMKYNMKYNNIHVTLFSSSDIYIRVEVLNVCY